uniref:Multidrug and toxin extrusion protein n=1 Tax=Electrophorus electricus TaxID=8005 RepID=A0A4W4DRX2_ELEEL
MARSTSRAEGLSTEPDTKMFCWRCWKHCLPQAYREELYHMLRMTGPLVVSRVLNYLLPFTITIFCGRLGNSVLAGYGMAVIIISITTAATGGGLALACDTLVAQTFGSKNLLQVGVILQRGILILLLFCLPCWALLINTQSLLLCLGQEPEVARIAQLYVVIYLPAVPVSYFSFSPFAGVIVPQMYTAIAANIANVLTNYIMVFWLDLGVYGSAVASCMGEIYSCTFLYGYIRWKRLHADTWGGWSLESLQDWGGYMKLAVPSMMMICFEWWIYEIGGFLAGLLGEVDLAAQHAVMMLANIIYMCPLGIQSATCVRVGNALGAGDTAGAILTSKVSLIYTAVLIVVQSTILASVKSVIGFIFTDDRQIVQLVSKILNIYCVLAFFDGLCVSMGVLLGSGQQKIAAVANLLGYYCIGLPLAISLMFAAKLHVVGFWVGLLISVCIQASFFITAIFKLNWERVTKEVRNAHHHMKKVLSPFQVQNGTGYQALSLQGCEEELGSEAQERLRADQEDEKRTAPLSTSQLVIRRGLTTLAATLVLAVGTAVHLFLPLPEVPDASRANATLHSNTTLQITTT